MSKEKNDEDDENKYEDTHKVKNEREEDRLIEKGTWVVGGREDENKRYRDFLLYCEEKREETRRMLEEDEDRKRAAKEKEKAWGLLRESIAFIRANDDKWMIRKIEECDRIREEEKLDRRELKRE